MADSPCVSSFVIRIIEESNPGSSPASYRGIVRHVQSDQRLSFTSWEEVENFIQQFAPIHLMLSPEESLLINEDSEQEIQT